MSNDPELLRRLEAIRKKLELIVCTSGQDAGVVYLSDEAPTHYDEEQKITVYDLQYFSPLGEALMALHKLTDLNHDLHPGLY